MYFGGIPSNLSVPDHTVPTETPFIGCLGDATVNGVLINFANSTQRPGAILGKCQAKDQVVGPVAGTPIGNISLYPAFVYAASKIFNLRYPAHKMFFPFFHILSM
jgi:hypothetical protein